VKETVGNRPSIHNWGAKRGNANVAGARFCSGRPDTWCIKYLFASSVRQEAACQSSKLPNRKKFVYVYLPTYVCMYVRMYLCIYMCM
jgi:hypothetical protein